MSFTTTVLSPAARTESIARMESEELDILVIGGGVVGAGTALDAVTRGLKVGLLEARDYAAGTSSRSSKLFHGGLRYLEQFNFSLVFEALKERSLVLNTLCPHLARPVPFIYPLEKIIDRGYVGLGIGVYDVMGAGRGVPGHHKHLGKKKTLESFPSGKRSAIRGAVKFYEGQVDDARHTMMLARTAAAYGALCANSTHVTGFLREDDKVVGVLACDLETGRSFEVRAKQVINAAGVWTDEVQQMVGGRGQFQVRASKGVHLIGHHETGGNIEVYEHQLADALDLYAAHGVDVVKTGYVGDAGGIISCNADIAEPCGEEVFEWHDGQRQVQHHLKVVTEAAKRGIAINPHEPVKDTGLRRTYPNWVSREGARGQEYNAWGAFANGTEHDPTLVYTRMLSGPMDYTPGVLGLVGNNGDPIASTLAKQLGLYLAIYSPIQMAADFVESLEAHPKELEFIRMLPADWAQSHLIAGEVADYAIFARKDRHSEDWYVGGVNDATERTVELRFDFLDDGQAYTARVWKDGPTATYETEARHDIAYDTLTIRRGDTYTVRLAPGGGLAMQLKPAE